MGLRNKDFDVAIHGERAYVLQAGTAGSAFRGRAICSELQDGACGEGDIVASEVHAARGVGACAYTQSPTIIDGNR